jgi:hypothetical protein
LLGVPAAYVRSRANTFRGKAGHRGAASQLAATSCRKLDIGVALQQILAIARAYWRFGLHPDVPATS